MSFHPLDESKQTASIEIEVQWADLVASATHKKHLSRYVAAVEALARELGADTVRVGKIAENKDAGMGIVELIFDGRFDPVAFTADLYKRLSKTDT